MSRQGLASAGTAPAAAADDAWDRLTPQWQTSSRAGTERPQCGHRHAWLRTGLDIVMACRRMMAQRGADAAAAALIRRRSF